VTSSWITRSVITSKWSRPWSAAQRTLATACDRKTSSAHEPGSSEDLVVSQKDDSERNDSVESDDFVMPNADTPKVMSSITSAPPSAGTMATRSLVHDVLRSDPSCKHPRMRHANGSLLHQLPPNHVHSGSSSSRHAVGTSSHYAHLNSTNPNPARSILLPFSLNVPSLFAASLLPIASVALMACSNDVEGSGAAENMNGPVIETANVWFEVERIAGPAGPTTGPLVCRIMGRATYTDPDGDDVQSIFFEPAGQTPTRGTNLNRPARSDGKDFTVAVVGGRFQASKTAYELTFQYQRGKIGPPFRVELDIGAETDCP
jgi:hypothetical protein